MWFGSARDGSLAPKHLYSRSSLSASISDQLPICSRRNDSSIKINIPGDSIFLRLLYVLLDTNHRKRSSRNRQLERHRSLSFPDSHTPHPKTHLTNMSTAQQIVDNAIASEYIVVFGKSWCRQFTLPLFAPSSLSSSSSLFLTSSLPISLFLFLSPHEEGQRGHCWIGTP